MTAVKHTPRLERYIDHSLTLFLVFLVALINSAHFRILMAMHTGLDFELVREGFVSSNASGIMDYLQLPEIALWVFSMLCVAIMLCQRKRISPLIRRTGIALTIGSALLIVPEFVSRVTRHHPRSVALPLQLTPALFLGGDAVSHWLAGPDPHTTRAQQLAPLEVRGMNPSVAIPQLRKQNRAELDAVKLSLARNDDALPERFVADVRRLPVSLRRFLQNLHVDSLLRHQLLQTGILPFQLFQTLCLIAPDAPVLLPPAIVRVVRHTNLTTCLGHIPAPRQQNLRFTKLPNDLFGPESFTWHSLPFVLEPRPEFTTPELVAVKGAGQLTVAFRWPDTNTFGAHAAAVLTQIGHLPECRQTVFYNHVPGCTQSDQPHACQKRDPLVNCGQKSLLSLIRHGCLRSEDTFCGKINGRCAVIVRDGK